MAENQCPCVCKFCQIYELGVYVINGSWLAIMIIAFIAYFPEIKAYFGGRLKSVEPSQGPVKIESTGTISIIPAGPESAPTTEVTPATTYRPEVQQAQLAPQSPVKAPPIKGPAPQPSTVINIPQPTQANQIPQAPQAARSPQTPQVAQAAQALQAAQAATQAVTTKQAVTDKFALPRPLPAIQPVAPTTPPGPARRGLKHESTGSDYYNMMLDGKKHVASISQYMLMQKQAKDQRRKEDKLKENRQKEEKKKGKKEKKRAALRSEERERNKARGKKRSSERKNK